MADATCEAKAESLMMLQSRAHNTVATMRRKSLWLTDLHADLYYLSDVRQCVKKNVSTLRHFPFGVMGCDPPATLLSETLRRATSMQLDRGADFALYTGDFSRHNMGKLENPYKNVSATIGKVSLIFDKHLPNISKVVGTLGNDDTPIGYFQNITTDRTTNRWFVTCGEELQNAHCMTKESRKEYDYGSYFEVRMGNYSILNIATVMYSVFHKPPNTSGSDPFHQFAWLRRKLTEAARDKRKVWIAGHIPPGIETFGYTELWEPSYLREYLNIVQDEVMGSVIAAQFFGHVHKDEIRILLNPPPGAGPIFLSLSLSPVYYNNPAFKTVTWHENGEVVDFDTFYAQMSNGSSMHYELGYSFRSLYALKKLSMESFVPFAQELLQGTEQWISYAKWYTATYPNDLNSFATNASDPPSVQKQKALRRQQYVCGVTIQSMESFEDCVESARLSIYKSVQDDLGAKAPLAPLVKAVPKTLDVKKHMIIARLLRWAELSERPEAFDILRLAEQHHWMELLQRYGPAVERSWEEGISLDDFFQR